VALILALLCAAFAAKAANGPLSSVSSDGLMGLVGAILFSLLAGYAKGQERRVTVVEHELKQLQSVVYNQPTTIQRDHPSRNEFEGLRDDMHRGFAEVKDLIRERR
jgi:hypothetical protein